MAILMDGHAITQLVLNASNGTSVTKQLTESGSVSVDDWDIYDKELIDTWGGKVYLHDDTTFDDITPSTSAQYFYLKTPFTKTFAVDLTNYRYFLLREEYVSAKYSGETGNYYFAKYVNIHAKFLGVSLIGNVQNKIDKITLSAMQYFYNTEGNIVALSNMTSYGIYTYDGNDSGGFDSTGSRSTNFSINAPAWMVRGSATVKPEYIAAIDSESSFIEYRYRFYRMPVETLCGNAEIEGNYAVENDGLRTLSSGT